MEKDGQFKADTRDDEHFDRQAQTTKGTSTRLIIYDQLDF